MNRRFASGLLFQTNYTYGKSLDDVSDDTNGAGTTFLLDRDANNRGLDRGRSNFDIRHQFRAGVVYELPFGKGHALPADRRAVVGRRRLDHQHYRRLVERLSVYGGRGPRHAVSRM